ncbi:MAG: flagellar hook-basal body complex protein [Desulfovibrionaceae bacterium]
MSAISSALRSSISGLHTYGKQLSIISSNVANSGSMGFHQVSGYATGSFGATMSTLAGNDSTAQGSTLATTYRDFGQGTPTASGGSTHLALSGEGFFGIRSPGSDELLLTRRGDFGFNVEGKLVNSEGYLVQGWEIKSTGTGIGSSSSSSSAPESRLLGTGVPQDINMPGDTSPPKHTSFIDIISNLSGGDAAGKSDDPTNPYFALQNSWDGTKTPPLGENQYSYQNTIKVFDESGGVHEISIYFDKVDPSPNGESHWEFIVTMPPESDKRYFNGAQIDRATDKTAGLLMSGILEFDSGGQLRDMLAFVPTPTVAAADLSGAVGLNNWAKAPLSSDGTPIFLPNFSGSPLPEDNGFVADAVPKNPISLSFGLYTSPISWSPTAPANAGAIGIGNPTGMSGPKQNNNATTNYAGSSSTTEQSRDGNSFGVLQDIQVDKRGVMTAIYSNGARIDFAQVSVYDVPDPQGLSYLQGSFYKMTNESGNATAGVAGTQGKANLQNYSLEMSNVDLATELANMILVQNSYTACTKMVTTGNQALNAVINMV